MDEEYEDRYLEEQEQQQRMYDENAQMDEYDEMYQDNNEQMYEDMKPIENRDINMHNRNDTNNNANGELYGYHNNHQPLYDDQLKNKTNLAINNNLSEEEYYEEYEDEQQQKIIKQNDRYEEEFDIEYAQNSNTTSKQQQQQQNIQKQMSVLSEDAHQTDEYMNGKNSMLSEEERAMQDEYLDEYPEDGIVSHHKQSAVSSMMRKQESVLEDDPELKLLEEKQIQKNQQMQQQQQQHQELYPQQDLDQYEIEMKQKNLVSINTDGDIIIKPHEKPQVARSAKQRWHWAYNRIVHQARVSELSIITFKNRAQCVH